MSSSPQPPNAQASAPRIRTKPHAVGVIALIAGVLGFVFACIPGALVIGWVLLPLAFVLSIIAFFLKGGKWPAIVGLILAVVGTIVGFVVFFAVVSSAVDEALGGSESSVTQPTEAAPSSDAPSGGAAAEEPSGEAGTRENPAPIGSTITGRDFEVVVNSVTLNATDEVVAASPANEAPAEGLAFAIVNLTVTYTGDDSGMAATVGVDYVTRDGSVITRTDTFAIAPEPALGIDELYNGASATGNVVLAIPVDDPGALRVRPGLIADPVFVAIQ